MFNSTVLEVGIGLIFCFCAVSLIVSSINEGLSSFLTLRGKYLLKGIQTLFNEHSGGGLVLELYKHAGFNPASNGSESSVAQMKHMPSYAEPREFALAFTEILRSRVETGTDLTTAINAIPDPQLRQLLTNLYCRAGADATRFEAELANWFDQAMQRLSGRYKRTLQWLTVLIGFVLAAMMNIDALHMFKVLWAHPALVSQLSGSQLADAHSAVAGLTAGSLPIGWEQPPFNYGHDGLGLNYSGAQLAQMAAGWAITASSTLFGAPFWFDLLQKVTNLRGTGPKVK
jgi:hypothetical protein